MLKPTNQRKQNMTTTKKEKTMTTTTKVTVSLIGSAAQKSRFRRYLKCHGAKKIARCVYEVPTSWLPGGVSSDGSKILSVPECGLQMPCKVGYRWACGEHRDASEGDDCGYVSGGADAAWAAAVEAALASAPDAGRPYDFELRLLDYRGVVVRREYITAE
jgi:hypothetical protein